MGLGTTSFVLFLCAMFFVVLFSLEGYSDDGWDGVKHRRGSISGTFAIALLFLLIFIISFPLK